MQISLFSELKQQLIQQLNSLEVGGGFFAIQAEIDLDQGCNLLAWLKGQPFFPQSFWQSRNQNTTFATLGAVQTFENLDLAQQFIQQFPFRLFGGIQFEGPCRFILPRLVLAKNHQKLTACLYVDSQKLIEEKAICSEFLDNFADFSELEQERHTLCNSECSSEKISDFSHWKANIQRAISAIQQQQFRKVVLANATTFRVEHNISPYDLLFASQQKNLGCYHFLWSEKADSAFIGSSPERLYQRQNRQLKTEALAGTVAVTDDVSQTKRNGLWLLSDQKNINENQLVVEDIHAHLADYVTEFEVSETEIKRLHNVQHLRRKIQGTLKKNITDADCLMRIHPTAAVAGLPRHLALPFIAEYEGFRRGWYAGTLGSFTAENAEFCVTLRSAQIEQNQITLFAGAGIVAGSDPQAEWEEIERKMLALGSLLFPH